MRSDLEDLACIVNIHRRDEMAPGCRVPSRSSIWPACGSLSRYFDLARLRVVTSQSWGYASLGAK
ncbi:uncharacterized protein BDR25DRAFT_357601 [Lindgomyces ingoldianus]|uniref:Uncharacterized protein n=1 Tax=Lindgomyces ingoldianus TaxID=673940 RepID=A0ACB6QQC6_9PLEO|nr:uncharacterized protein BDR25DRAFT_357601 [Lindgomyces ingoldianus]KAF2468305.1 hypothetical protein BDR25DRAFT_357601 [Lindgomyces ingoldianus]